MSATTTDTPPAARVSRRTRRPEPALPITPPPKLRRRPMLVAVGVALIALGGIGAGWLATNVGHTHPVIALRDTVDRGSLISAADLTTVDINTDSRLQTVPASGMDGIVNKRAANDLAAGSLLTPDSVTTATVPSAGHTLVGLALTAAQMPAITLRNGSPVRIVATPRSQDSAPTTAPATISATIVDTHPGGDPGETIVDVSVDSKVAPLVAAEAATARIALILDPAA